MELTEHLTNEQKEILKQFRINLKDILTPAHTDTELLKWLRARNFNPQKAAEHFREVYWNRITYGINTITETFEMPEVLQKFRGDAFLGFAKDGSPVRYITMAADFYGFLHSLSNYHLILYYCYLMELDTKAMEEGYKKTGKKSDRVTYIINMEGFSYQNLSYKIVIEMGLESIRLFQDHYPESWNNILFINAPSIFSRILSIFKPIIKETLLGNLQCASKENTPKLLYQYIDEDVLPVFLGGKRLDSKGDPHCKEFIYHAGIIPEQFYLRNRVHLIQEKDPRVKVATVRARSVYNLSFVLRELPAKYRLEMRTVNGGITFSILYRKIESISENVELPSEDEYLDPHNENSNVKLVGTRLRCESHCAPNDGWANPIGPGLYILQFDNTDSWFTSKKLFYRLTIYSQESFIETSD